MLLQVINEFNLDSSSSSVESHWTLKICVLSGLIILIYTNRMSSMSSAAKLLLTGLEWLATNTALWIISSHQSTNAYLTILRYLELFKLTEVLSKLICHYYWRLFLDLLLLF